MDIIVRNIRVAYTAAGFGPELLLLHAWGADSRSLAPLARSLNGQARCISLDLPGAGESDPPQTPFDLAAYGDFLQAFMDEVCGEKPFIFGHGLGGRLGLLLAAQGKAKGLILCGANPGPADYAAFPKKKRRAEARPAYLDGAFPDSDPARQYAEAAPGEQELLALTGQADLLPLLADITCPTLLIWGEEDAAAPTELAWQLEAGLADAGLCLLPGCGHAPFAEAPKDFALILRYFLAQCRERT